MSHFKMRFGALLLLAVMLVIVSTGCGAYKSNENNKPGSGSPSNQSDQIKDQEPDTSKAPEATKEPEDDAVQETEPENDEPELLGADKHPVVTIEMSNDKIIKAELYPEVAPNTVSNFISLIQSGFYDGLMFHRVIPGFMIQGGDPQGNGTGGPGYSIPGEFTENGFTNKLKHTRGVLSMARSGMPDSAGSQFFIMVDDAPYLDKLYASFGMVTEGMDVVDEIVNQDRDAGDKPLEPLAMKKVTVDTLGMTFGEPVKVE